ncbi:hypothetical protein NQ317_015251 [Molorchus minor]|uniref:DDE Tnp4 domain-containing protein n=1 Tax=Molorchus minor TaxID=1323400 RepID=A0ABQ9JQ03_9CUCU|nr:hypothetical protein NQ317_015251 [Molorchus minor]
MESSSDEEFVIVSAICADEEERERKTRRKHRFWEHEIFQKRRQFGEFHHLFPDLLNDDAKFFLYFRMSRNKFYELFNLLNFSNKYTPFREPVCPEERLALTLKQQWEEIEREFYEMWNFPNCCGALDGKHVVIEKPPRSGSLFFNYKHQHSIVLLALVDATYRFVTVDVGIVGAYGRNSDGGIFSSSALGKKLYANKLNFPPDKALPNSNTVLPCVIVADAAFPLKDNIMRPYPAEEIASNEAKKVYEYRHSRARRVVENAFELLTKKFKWYSTKYNILPKNVDKIILGTVVLYHNFLRNDKCSWQPGELETEEDFCILRDLPHIGGRTPFSAGRIREAFTEYFVSPNGSVPWQLQRKFLTTHYYERKKLQLHRRVLTLELTGVAVRLQRILFPSENPGRSVAVLDCAEPA